jgi:hypothetical protein
VTIEDRDNFDLILHYFQAYPYKHGNFLLVSISMEIYPLNGTFSKISYLHGKLTKNSLVSW